MADLLVGEPNADPSGLTDVGRVTVYSGATGVALWSATGLDVGDGFGTSVAFVDDIDGDGAKLMAARQAVGRRLHARSLGK